MAEARQVSRAETAKMNLRRQTLKLPWAICFYTANTTRLDPKALMTRRIFICQLVVVGLPQETQRHKKYKNTNEEKQETLTVSNKAIVDYTSPELCTPVTPCRRQAMRPIVNVLEED